MRDDLGNVTDHRHPGRPVNEHVKIQTCGVQQHGFFRTYEITSNNGEVNQYLDFQEGSIPEVGLNGLTNEALLAVVIDRLRDAQAGPFPCRQNALALTKAEEALMWLHNRTTERIARDVEGKHEA